jgi:hypothetical protein
MAATRLMAGNKGGLHGLTEQSAPEAIWTHCMIHCESPSMKELCPELSEMRVRVIKTVNYIKTPQSKTKFCRIMQRNCRHSYQSPLFHSNS